MNVAAPCARLQLVRGPVRKCSCGRPFNGIVSPHENSSDGVGVLELLPGGRIGGLRPFADDLCEGDDSIVRCRHLSRVVDQHYVRRS